MSTASVSIPANARPRPTRNEVTAVRVLRSEWIKLFTLRSSQLTLLAAAGIMIVGGAILGYVTSVADWSELDEGLRAPSASMAGFVLAQLVIGVLGVLFVTSEYSTGMIRSTFAAVPRRVSVLAAKSVVIGAVTLVVMTVAALMAFLGAQIFLAPDGHGTSLGDSGVLRAIVGIGVYMAFVGTLGGALGWILRSSAASIGVLVGLLLVMPSVMQLLPDSIKDSLNPYAPTNAGEAIWSGSSSQVDLLSPLAAGVVLLAWLGVTLVIGAAVVRRRDA